LSQDGGGKRREKKKKEKGEGKTLKRKTAARVASENGIKRSLAKRILGLGGKVVELGQKRGW